MCATLRRLACTAMIIWAHVSLREVPAVVAVEYNRLVYESTGWRGAYPLLLPIRVGDYFQLRDDGIPIHLGNVLNWPSWKDAVPVDSETVVGSETFYSGCQRKTGVSAGAGVQIPGGVSVNSTLSLSFSREASFVLAYDAGTRTHMRDVVPIQRSILESARSGWWQEDWILVVEVIAAQSATLAVATEKDSELDLHANAGIPTGIAGVPIAKPALGWTASGWKGSGYCCVCQPGTPLYHCLKLRKGRFGNRWRAELLEEVDPADLFTGDPFDTPS